MTSHNTSPPSDQASGIFINYRREDTAGHAGRLHDVLNQRFPGAVFMDIDKIEAGQDFVDVIDEAVGKCRVLLVMIGRQWLSVATPDGRRRLDNPDDFVRREIAAALIRDVTVVPVLVEGAGMPQQQDLPEELKKLSRRNAVELSDTRWAYDVDRLVEVLEKHVEVCEAGADKDATGRLGGQTKEKTAKKMKAALVAGFVLLVVIGLTTGFLLSRQNTKAPQVSAAPSEAEVREQESINNALLLIGRCKSAADDMLKKLTSKAYDPSNFPNDKNSEIEKSIEAEVLKATEEFNAAEEEWNRQQPKLDLLMNGRPTVNAAWLGTKKAVTDYMKCVTDLEAAKGEGEPIEKFQNCTVEKKNTEENVNLLTTSLGAASR
jgi:hypothetical protein